MTYVCDWSLELPVIINGVIVAYCPDVDCVLSLDEEGDLWKVGFRQHGALLGDGFTWVFKGHPLFDAAKEAVERNREHIMDICEIPPVVRERPEYTGREYHPISF